MSDTVVLFQVQQSHQSFGASKVECETDSCLFRRTEKLAIIYYMEGSKISPLSVFLFIFFFLGAPYGSVLGS